ncbi:hypothetical protein ATL39_3109 [Sinobaca qinghaiensis]|uniref:Uncharacterized protein n=1 Tax=Sinobaca qinghaiensis TaxID=342944 RepID=A0A419UX11_9BACL|nr:hypothetical protein [Sinobaca qinghaiensis]RKD69683.1 hypothetical protein ATL39_3109 [Sinobaca qinghaiensis]
MNNILLRTLFAVVIFPVMYTVLSLIIEETVPEWPALAGSAIAGAISGIFIIKFDNKAKK